MSSTTARDGDLLDEVGATVVMGEASPASEMAARRAGRTGRAPWVAPGTVAVFSDVGCPFATLALHRFRTARERLGATDRVRLDLHSFLLEDVNREPTPKQRLTAEVEMLADLAPEVGWRAWEGSAGTWPVSMLLPNEAVQAAKQQSPLAAEELDWALRMAFFRDCRCITMRDVVEDVASGCPHVDVPRLMRELDDGTWRGAMWEDHRSHRGMVQASPHFFAADGWDVVNPGMELGSPGDDGVPPVRSDDPAIFETIVASAASSVRPVSL